MPARSEPSDRFPPAAREAILAWYDAHGRPLAFRSNVDPYAVLVAETMAQQTQIGRVVERWGAFLERFPTVDALGAAAPADVLREWQGLGYNRRAINLWRAARAIVADHGGRIPDSVSALERLPGIGPYTARAVAATAFGRPVGAVDTNVRRVVGRMAAVDEAPEIQHLADAIVPPERAADWTHAMMDVGATFCRPRRPACAGCPVRSWCRFAASPTADTIVSRGRPRRPEPAFPSTSRWLRGRIVERLRGHPGGSWAIFDQAIGDHAVEAVAVALAGLARDGLVELDPIDPTRARLPLA